MATQTSRPVRERGWRGGGAGLPGGQVGAKKSKKKLSRAKTERAKCRDQLPNAGKPLKWIQQHLLLGDGARRVARRSRTRCRQQRESKPRSRSTRVLLGCLHGRYEGRRRAAGRWRLRTSSQLRRFEQQIERFAPFCCSISKLLSAAHELAPLEATRRSKSIAIGMQQPDITSTNQYCIECIDLS